MAYRALEVTLLSAKDLKNVNLITRMEVYAVATISGDPITRQCTPPDPHGGRNPTWNATLRFNVPATAEEARGGCLHVLLRAERMFGGDRDVGEVIVPLAELLTGGGLGAPSSPRFASYQVCKVHRSETRGSLYLTYRLGPVIPPPPHAKQADGWPVVGYPAQQVTPPSSPAKPPGHVAGLSPPTPAMHWSAMQVSVPSSHAKPAGHGDGPFSPGKPAAGYVCALPSPKPYGYGYETTPPPSPRPRDQVVCRTPSPKPVGRVVSMPPPPKPSDQFVSMRGDHALSMPPSPPAGRAISMPPSPSAGRAISMPPSPKPAEVPMPASPKSGGGHASSPRSAGGYVSSPLKPSVHDMPPSPSAGRAISMPPSPKPAEVPMPASPKPGGGHASSPKSAGGYVSSPLKPSVHDMPPSPSAGRAISMPPSPKPAEVPMPASLKSGGGHASSPKSAGGYVSSPLKPSLHDMMPPSPRPETSMAAVPSSPRPAGGHNIAMPSSPKPFGGHASTVPPSPTPPYDQAVGERIFTMTMTDAYRCSVLQRGAATNPN